MKAAAFNGSARKDGNTAILINHVFAELKNHGIETEMVQLAGIAFRCARSHPGVLDCYYSTPSFRRKALRLTTSSRLYFSSFASASASALLT